MFKSLKCTATYFIIAILLNLWSFNNANQWEAVYQSSHQCERPCADSEQPMVCYYRFRVEWYYTLSKACFDCPINISHCSNPHCIAANGVEKPIIVVNRQLPGPSIQVCENDTILVDVENHAGSEATAIHWHGIHQVGTQYMDGVPMITQCPILPHNTFRYRFNASPAGTHFWHSHAGLQRSDGVHGMLVIRQPLTVDPNANSYDHDLPQHTLMITDWLSDLSFDRFVAHHHDNGTNKPQSILLNGKGRFKAIWDPKTQQDYFTPLEILKVNKGQRYRFRMASNGILNCPLQVSVDNHTMAVIATDGHPVKAIKVESLVIYAGERFDFIIIANQSVDNYWIRMRGLLDCDERFTRATQVAVLHYDGAPYDHDPQGPTDYFHMGRSGNQLNPLNSGSIGDKISVADLDSLLPNDRTSEPETDLKFYLPYDFSFIDNKHFHNPYYYPIHAFEHEKRMYTPQFNDISLQFPHAPLLSQPEVTPSHLVCNHTSMKQNCTEQFCECVYMLSIPLEKTVELIFIDKGFVFEANHPIHIHGLSFRVVAMQRLGENVTLEKVLQLENEGKIHRKLDRAVLKDTVTVPDGGYTIIRFHATNPGYWLLHCHIEFHIEVGMGIILHVGERNHLPPVPENFPRCGNWAPGTIDTQSTSSRSLKALPNSIHVIFYTALLCIFLTSSL